MTVWDYVFPTTHEEYDKNSKHGTESAETIRLVETQNGMEAPEGKIALWTTELTKLIRTVA